ncbi:MAG: hypothetical protein RL199_736 [Pseudomonadota bacterium]|jgi:hypothetical protein
MTRHERRTCPACNAAGAIPLVFGAREPGLGPLAHDRRVAPGGRMPTPEVPSFECLGCGHAFGFTSDDHAAADALLDELSPDVADVADDADDADVADVTDVA